MDIPEPRPRAARDGAEPHAIPGAEALVRSVLANWIWYVLVFASGFLLPRMIDRHQGRELLGIWDFSWSLVVYINFLSFGVSSAVNRYVARYRATGDWRALNEVVTSSLLVLIAAGLLGLLLAVGFAMLLPQLLAENSPEEIRTGQTLVLLLALVCGWQLPGGVFNGIITGWERFDLLNGIRFVRDLATLGASLLLLVNGYGLIALGATVLISETLGEVAKVVVSRILCRDLRFSPRFCRPAVVRELLSFGGKTVVQSVARGGIYQGSNLLVGIFLGPALLAVFARQLALVMHTLRFVKQYAQVFVPRSSFLDAAGDTRALQRILVQTSAYGLYITLPIVLVLVIMGGPVLRLWMGADYAVPGILAILALGHLLCIPQMGVYSVLMGLGRHGPPAWFDLGAAGLSVALGALLLGPFDLGLLGAAIGVTVPVAISGGILLPLYACRVLKLSMVEYLRQSVPGPLLACLPLTGCLIAARLAPLSSDLLRLALGLLAGGSVTAYVYWQWVLPRRVREKTGVPRWRASLFRGAPAESRA